VESVLNGFFFAKGSEFGLLGGIGIAVGISIVNVIFSFMLGLWPARWINHRNWLVKILALLTTIAGIGTLILLHGSTRKRHESAGSHQKNSTLPHTIAMLSPLWARHKV
jgi:hypothetical protein